MIDALGAPASVLVLGGASQIGVEIVLRLADRGRLERVVLAARPGPHRDAAAVSVGERVPGGIEVVDFEAAATDGHGALIDAVWAGGDVDVVVVAAAVLPDQDDIRADPGVAVAAAQANYVGPMSVTLQAARRLRTQGHGVLVVLSSVAAERPRVANYVYGSTKAGLDAFATGLGDDLHGSGVTVLVVRPGFVIGRMTAGLPPAPFATTPGAVADAVAAHLTTGTRTIWVPGVLRYAMSALRHLPRGAFRRLSR